LTHFMQYSQKVEKAHEQLSTKYCAAKPNPLPTIHHPQ